MPQNIKTANYVEHRGLMTITQTATGLLRNILHQLPAPLQQAGRNLLGQTMITMARENIERMIVYKNSPINTKNTHHRMCLGMLMVIASIASQLNKKFDRVAPPVRNEENYQNRS
jgi:hypothetical protein